MEGQGHVFLIQQRILSQLAVVQRRASRLPDSRQKFALLQEIERLNQLVAQLQEWFFGAVRDLL